MGAINPKICETLHLTSPLTISLRREKFFSILRFCEWVGAFLVDLCEAGYVSSSTPLLQRSGENGVCVCECGCVHAWPALFVIPAMVFGDTLLWNRLFEMRESIEQTAEGPRRWSEWDGQREIEVHVELLLPKGLWHVMPSGLCVICSETVDVPV